MFAWESEHFTTASVQKTFAEISVWYAVAGALNGGGGGTNGRIVAVAGGSDRFIYTSTNSGDTWSNAGAPNSEYWYGVASSADGVKLVAVSNSNTNGLAGAIYTSTNSGATWRSNNLGGVYWNGVASSADGVKLVAVAPGGIYRSTNSGASWTLTTQPSGYWVSVASSADGSKLAVMAYNKIYTSTDSGATWISNNIAVVNWTAVAMSLDGIRLLAAAGSGGIYTATATPVLQFAYATNLTLTWPWPAASYGLQQNPNLATTNWVAVTNVAVVTNWQNQVQLTPGGGLRCFRLKSP